MIIKRIMCCVLLFLFINLVYVIRVIPSTWIAVPVEIVLGAFYVRFNIIPLKDPAPQRRLRILNGGCELMLTTIFCFTSECLTYLYIFLGEVSVERHILIVNALVCGFLLFILLVNGILRIFLCSTQLGILPRILLVFFWWVPVANIIFIQKYLRISRLEYRYTIDQYQLNEDRKQEEICKTKYPILMVHGVFFRDWENFNYWGRIPKVLSDNGATIHYGNHQSSASVENSAEELKQCILDIVRENGCEKVNIIAHSKGGLDSRFAISCLGAGEHVASLTTINTPHLGCNYVRKLLQIIPYKLVESIGKKYKSIYTKLGDENPDFFSGLKDLTDKECTRLNGIMKDNPNVCYQSVGSRMRSPSGAMFPMNVGYCLIKLLGGGDNDGLTSTKSMVWGNFLGTLHPQGRQGISHGDMIDLTRKNIEGFDVCEFYVDLVNKLRQMGF